MRTVITVTICILLVAVGAVGFAYSGLYNVGASSPHSGFSNWLMSTTSQASIARHSRDIEAPDLTDETLVSAGVNDFDAMCAACHGAPGRSPDSVGKGLNPPAPDLAESAARLSAAELFWVTKNGIKMTGMPAWGASHDDDAIWPVVAFMGRLPELDADGYQALLVKAEGIGHHEPDAEAPHDHGSADMESVESTIEEDDHSIHSHQEPVPEPASEAEDDGHEDHQH